MSYLLKLLFTQLNSPLQEVQAAYVYYMCDTMIDLL